MGYFLRPIRFPCGHCIAAYLPLLLPSAAAQLAQAKPPYSSLPLLRVRAWVQQ